MYHTYKTELIRNVSKETRLSQRIVSEVLRATLREIGRTLAGGQIVTLPGFGVFYTRNRGEAKLRDVRTRTTLTVPAMRVAAFRVGEVLKRAVRTRNGRKRRWLPAKG